MPNYFLSSIKKKQYALVAIDALIILLALVASEIIVHDDYLIERLDIKIFLQSLFIVAIYIFSLYIHSQYNLSTTIETRRSRASIIFALSTGFLVVFFLRIFPQALYQTKTVITHYIFLTVSIYSWRLLFLKYIIIRDIPLRVLVLGDKKKLQYFINDFKINFINGFVIIGAYSKSSTDNIAKYEDIDGKSSYFLNELLFNDDYDLILYDTEKQYLESADIEAIIKAKFTGKAIYDIASFYQEMTGKTPINIINGAWLLHTAHIQGREKRFYFRIKRLIDILLSALLMILLSPIMISIALCLKFSGQKKVMFVQERLCTHRDVFNCFKFHTMFTATENERQQPQWATQESIRITPFGRFLRKSRLDELPQLWNILKGEMSFVGPRPIREHFANQLAQQIPFYDLRFMVKPGLSGWAQVNLGYADSFESQLEKYRYELFYLQNMSLLLDLFIIIKTMQMVIKGEGR
jgi:exopolysaccharide biosynthesis polyprenyl glycosylphosphotransferase